MSHQPERRRGRSDDELRRQRRILERQWEAQQRSNQRKREADNSEERLARVEVMMLEHHLHDARTAAVGDHHARLTRKKRA